MPARDHAQGCSIGDRVADDRVRLQRAETVRKARRHPQLPAVRRSKLLGDELAEGRRAGTDIDCHVEQSPRRAGDELPLYLCSSWKCRPRTVPTSADIDELSWTNL